ncbi:SDR family NAD(P)-dependent oxidoreductase [soil metagenome]
MARRTLAGLRVIITGASQGIGRALAVEAAKRGMKVVATARTPDLLNELVKEVPAIIPCVADVTDPAGRQRMIDTALKSFGGLDLLINNAGIGATGHFMDSEPETLRQIFETNYFGLCEITRLAIPELKKGVTPAIVNISSVVGRRAIPARGLYAASKFAVAGFSEAIRAELAKDNIDVIVINPGLTQTNFSKNMLESKARMPMDHMRGMTSEQVAVATLDAAAKGKTEVTLTFKGKMMVLTARFAPWIVDHFSKKKVRELFAEEMAARKLGS